MAGVGREEDWKHFVLQEVEQAVRCLVEDVSVVPIQEEDHPPRLCLAPLLPHVLHELNADGLEDRRRLQGLDVYGSGGV